MFAIFDGTLTYDLGFFTHLQVGKALFAIFYTKTPCPFRPMRFPNFTEIGTISFYTPHS